MKKVLSLVLAAMMLLACCSALAEAPEGYPEVKEGIDFGGKDVYIYDYWTGTDWVDTTPNTDEEQAQRDYRTWLQDTYNVKLHQIQKGDWGTCAQEMIDFVANGGDANSYALFIIEPGKVGSLMANGVAAPLNYDFSAEKWNRADLEFMSKNGVVYGVATGASEPRQCLYFNKRVLDEAGIKADDIYDLQAEGKWTWAAWEDMLKTLTQDKDNDGVIDIWGVTGSMDDMYSCAIFTNGGSYFDFDENGKLVPTMDSDAAIDGMNFAKNIFQNYFYQQPADGNWDYYKEAFKAGNIGFYMYQTYGGFNDNSEMADMEDEWGCVAFPVPEEGGNYLSIISDNITMVPAIYSEEEVEKLMFIYDMWSNATPGYDDEDGWIGNKYNYTDDRAVDETYAMLRESEHAVANKVLYLGTQNDVLGNSLLWQLGGNDPKALIEAGMPAWQARCDVFNGDMTQEAYDAMLAAEAEEAPAE